MAHPLMLTAQAQRHGNIVNVDRMIEPLRFCGRQWAWITDKPSSSIRETACKIITVPFLIFASAIAGIIASVKLLTESGHYAWATLDHPTGDQALLSGNQSDSSIAQRIQETLKRAGYEYQVTVTTTPGRAAPGSGYFEDKVSRSITIRDSSKTALHRFFGVLKRHFQNKGEPDFSSLYNCVWNSSPTNLQHLHDTLAFSKTVKVFMAFDLAYARVEISN